MLAPRGRRIRNQHDSFCRPNVRTPKLCSRVDNMFVKRIYPADTDGDSGRKINIKFVEQKLKKVFHFQKLFYR